MNRIIRYLLLSGTVAVMTASCTYLDKQPDNLRTSDQIWQTRDDAEAFLNQVYSYIWYNLDDFVGLGVADETSLPMTGLNARQLIEGQWTASNYLWNNWTPSYNAIRTALEFEANIDRVPDDRISPELKATYKCESKFLRGWFYWKLLQMYGPFIKVEEPISTGADFASYQRAPFDECVKYVCQLLTEAASGLEDKRMVAMEYGRPTKAACLAVIAQVRLLAASELWNGNPDFANFRNHDGTLLAPQTYDAHKWELAADAAWAVIELDAHKLYYHTENGVTDPYLSFRDLFLEWNDEIIFATNRTDWESGHDVRCTAGPGGYSMQNATQNIVDAFYMRDGRDRNDPESQYSGYVNREKEFCPSDDPARYGFSEDGVNRGYLGGTSYMYVDREPRFYASISYNGQPVLAAVTVDDRNYYSSEAHKDGRGRAEYYYSGLSGVGNNSGNPDFTGYNVAKRVSPAANVREWKSPFRPYIHIRYAEILLDYIEALNEYDPGNRDIVTYFDQIRDRAGSPGIAATYPDEIGDKDKMRARILRERQIELAFEGDRYWTLCRRKLFEQEQYRTVERMNTLADDGGQGFGFADFYTRVKMPLRYWDPNNKMYLFPIPQPEIDKSLGVVQNPGW